MTDSEQTLCSCSDACKHQKKIDTYNYCASDNYNCLHACEPDFNFEPDFSIKVSNSDENVTSDPIDQFVDLLENPKVKSLFEKIVNDAVDKKIKDLYKTTEFKGAVETVIVTSDLEIPSRLRAVEKVTGTYIFEEWEEHEPTIPEQISIIEEKIENFAISTPILPLEIKSIIPETKTEARAVFLVQYLENEVKERSGELFLNGSEIKDFITRVIPEKDPELAPKKDQNIRKIKKDVLAKVKKIFGNKIEIDTNKHGRHETRIFLRSYPTVPS